MVFQDAYITDAGATLLARSAAGEGAIVWGEARTSSLDTDDYTTAQMNAITTATFGTYTSDGQVANAIVNDDDGSVTLHCELSNENYSGTARTFGVWAKVEGDVDEELAIVARSGDGATPTIINPDSVCPIKLFVDFTIDISEHQASAVAVTEGYYATAAAMQAETTAREALEQNRWRIYKDLWEAMQYSKDGEWFSLSADKPRAFKVESYGAVFLTGYSPCNFVVLQFLGPWMLCKAYEGTPNGYTEMCIGVSHVSDFGGWSPYINARFVLSTSTADKDSVFKLLWVNDDDVLYEKDGVIMWKSGASFTHSGYFHRSSAGLVRVLLNGSDIEFAPVTAITPSSITVGDTFAVMDNSDYIYSGGSQYFRSMMLMGLRIGLFYDGDWHGQVGAWQSTGYYGSESRITNAENAVITYSYTVYINGTTWYSQFLATDCASKQITASDSEGTYTLTRDVKGLSIPFIMSDYVGDLSSANTLSEVNELRTDTEPMQPCGFFCCTIQGDGAYVIPWPGSYGRMVNRNGFLLPYLDNPPEYASE